MKVARHEMPGKLHPRNRPGGYGMIWVMMPFDRYTQTDPAADRSYRSLEDGSRVGTSRHFRPG
jgi:hypothetical protein